MVTWHPSNRVTPEKKVASDECEVEVKLLPSRCIIDQRAVKFTKAFFNNSDEDSAATAHDWTEGLNLLPPPFLRMFRVRPVKLKIDYMPQQIDIAALKNGSVVELINLSPLDAMVLTLHQVQIENVDGFGEALGGLISRWLGDICATQMHKFLTNARPFEPLTSIGGGVADLFVLPWDAYKNGGKVSRAIQSGVSSLIGTVAHETLTTSSRLTGFIAGEMAKTTGNPLAPSGSHSSLPSRPLGTPRHVGDTAGHALESLARGVQTANYKVIIVPYREYCRSGARGAAKSIVKGIPVAVAAPVSGVSEALSYTLLGARNQIRPDIRKEEEVCQRGLHYDGV
jgi:autophagy-related protein 2